MLPEFVGNVPGPVSQFTLWVTEAASHWNVIVPCGTVSGVGEKLLPPLPTVIVVECPPGGGGGGGAGGGLVYPVLLPQAAARAIAAIASKRTIVIAPPCGKDVVRLYPGSSARTNTPASIYWTTMMPLMLAL